MKTIGLIGGMSWESSAVYYQIVNQRVQAHLGGVHSAQTLLYSVDFGEIARLQHAGNWAQLAELLVDAAHRLERGGADFLVLCTNTMHKLADHLEQHSPLPLLHIADATAAAIRQRGQRKAGLLGTRFTMEQDFLRGRLAQHQLDVLIPDEQDRSIIHNVIYEELVKGIIREESRREYVRIIGQLTAAGAEGIILGCTEIGLLVTPSTPTPCCLTPLCCTPSRPPPWPWPMPTPTPGTGLPSRLLNAFYPRPLLTPTTMPQLFRFFSTGLLLLSLGLAACNQQPRNDSAAAAASPATYFQSQEEGVQDGGVKVIPISTPKGTFNVWTKRFGNNPTMKVLLLNGGPGATHEYFECMENFLPKEGIEFIYYDQLGCGNSDNPKDTSMWSLPRYVEEVEQVRKTLNLSKDNFYLLGHSWGGILAAEYAFKYQQNLKGLIISNMMMSCPDYGRYADEVLAKQMKPEVLAEIRQIEAKKDFSNPRYMQLLEPNFYAQHLCRIVPNPSP
ncbi:proline iminopeptidase-family hydrolase [Hymenobacter cellulosilyticus]|uniref:proline iminopeptidase-family hydrolase n=1 Tax=Hymenobacter cellulosilyticus TaxID=2932248 RepID=UPI002880685F|nr:proline iminopeptidase-family hydrolase [Hymenobacter cellulosilyticus]